MTSKLDREERILISKWRKLGHSIRSIAKSLGRAASTVSTELRRNRAAYVADEPFWKRAEIADQLFRERRSRASRKMRLKSEEIRWYVDFHLRLTDWTPQLIAGKLGTLGYRISAEAIYQFINIERPDLKQYLLVAGKSRRRRMTGKRHRKLKQPAAPKRSIELLPEAAKNRTEIGHFELDAIVGKQGKSALQNKMDRRSRKMFLDKVPNLQAQTYADILIKRMKNSVPNGVLKTWLQDNGAEHAEHARIDQELGTLSHFCHPHCAPERGTIEKGNRHPRRCFPKGTDFDDIPDEYVEWVEDRHNHRPMKLLGFKTPNQVWEEELKKAA